MTQSTQRLLNTFLAGLLAVLPLVATVLVIGWLVRFIYAWVGPGSAFGQLLRRLGLGLTESEWVAYLIGLGLVLLLIFLLGLVVRTSLARFIQAGIETLVKRIPVVRNIYDVVTSLVDLIAQRDNDKLKSMSPVWLHFGGPGGAAVLGLLSTPAPVRIGEHDYLAVLVPTAPVPVGGGLIYVPASWVTPAEIGMEALTSIYVSMGVTTGQHLPTGQDLPAPRSPHHGSPS